jgi:carbonic anhydrase
MRIIRGFALSITFVFLASCASVQPVPDDPSPTPIEQWNKLVAGNASFQTGTITFTGLNRRLDSQNPPVTMLACSDSRVAPELVFQQSLNRLFIVRSAGNVADAFGIASIEYAISKKWTKLLVILAHEKCGAVEEAIPGEPPLNQPTPSLYALVMKIRQSFDSVPGVNCTIDQPGCWTRRTRENAEFTIDDLKSRSDTIRKAIDDDKLPVIVAYYDLDRNVTVWKTVNIAIPAQ